MMKPWMFAALAIGIVVTQFQNCAPPGMGDLTMELASLSVPEEEDDIPEFDQNHPDQNHGADVPVVEKPGLSQSSTLLDRKTLYNIFVDIFGPGMVSLRSMAILKADKAVLGSPCSIYDNFKSKRADFEIDPAAEPCTNSDAAAALSAPLNPVGNVLHQALINNVCQQAIANVETLNYILAQIRGAGETDIPANTQENATRLFYLFYRGKPAPYEALINSLQILVAPQPTVTSWKTAISTICVSSHWQGL